MKKGVSILFSILFVFSLIFIQAANESIPTNLDKLTISANAESLAGKDAVEADLKKTAENLKDKSKTTFQEEIEVPEILKFPVRIMFGIKEDSQITTKLLIFLFAVWIFIMLIIQSAIKFAPFADSNIKSFSIAIIIMLIAGSSGVILQGAALWGNMISSIKILEEWNVLAISITIIVFGVLYFIMRKLSKYSKNQSLIEGARRAGSAAGLEAAKMKILSRS